MIPPTDDNVIAPVGARASASAVGKAAEIASQVAKAGAVSGGPGMPGAAGEQPAETLFCLRRELRSSLHENRGQRYFMIEDPAREAFFRLGVVEWHLAAKLDGKTRLAEAYAEVCGELGDDAMSPEKAQSVCQWLGRSGLLKTAAKEQANAPAMPEVRGPALLMSAFFFRIPLLHPDGWLEKVLPFARWSFTPLALVAWTVLVALGASSVIQNWERFQTSAAAYFSPHTWIYLGWYG